MPHKILGLYELTNRYRELARSCSDAHVHWYHIANLRLRLIHHYGYFISTLARWSYIFRFATPHLFLLRVLFIEINIVIHCNFNMLSCHLIFLLTSY